MSLDLLSGDSSFGQIGTELLACNRKVLAGFFLSVSLIPLTNYFKAAGGG